MSLRFLQLSDVELGARSRFLGAAQSARTAERHGTFRDAVHHALDPGNRIDAVLVPGNLFHGHSPGPELVDMVSELFGRLADAGRLVVISPGCRDSAIYKNSIYRKEAFPGALTLIEHEPGPPVLQNLRGRRVAFYALNPRPGQPDQPFPGWRRSTEGDIHIGLTCGTMPDSPERDLHPRGLLIEPESLALSGLDYVALAGQHGQRIVRCGEATAAYAGTLEGLEFVPGDLGRKSLLVVEVGDGPVRFERHPISRRVLDRIEIHLENEAIREPESLLAAIRARGHRDLMAQIRLTGPLEFVCDFSRIARRADGHYGHLELVDDTDMLGSALLRRIEGETTVRGIFVRRILRRLEDARKRAERSADPGEMEAEIAICRRALRIGLEPFLARDDDALSTDSSPQPQVLETVDVAT